MSKVVRIKADLVRELEKRFPQVSLSDVVDRLLRFALGKPNVTKITTVTEPSRIERWLEHYGKKWETLIKLVELHHLKYHRAKEVPDDVRELIDKLKEEL